jgi:hypothetical protein
MGHQVMHRGPYHPKWFVFFEDVQKSSDNSKKRVFLELSGLFWTSIKKKTISGDVVRGEGPSAATTRLTTLTLPVCTSWTSN